MAAKDLVAVKAAWLSKPLPMLPGGGSTHIGSGPAWKGWSLAVCRVTNELLITPPKDTKCGRLRVPMSNVTCYQLSTAAVKNDD